MPTAKALHKAQAKERDGSIVCSLIADTTQYSDEECPHYFVVMVFLCAGGSLLASQVNEKVLSGSLITDVMRTRATENRDKNVAHMLKYMLAMYHPAKRAPRPTVVISLEPDLLSGTGTLQPKWYKQKAASGHTG